jgi:hypothetical protein
VWFVLLDEAAAGLRNIMIQPTTTMLLTSNVAVVGRNTIAGVV